jgi:hypothetical protein
MDDTGFVSAAVEVCVLGCLMKSLFCVRFMFKALKGICCHLNVRFFHMYFNGM